jgi:hypothetical protein
LTRKEFEQGFVRSFDEMWLLGELFALAVEVKHINPPKMLHKGKFRTMFHRFSYRSAIVEQIGTPPGKG